MGVPYMGVGWPTAPNNIPSRSLAARRSPLKNGWLEDDPFQVGFGNFSGENSLLNFGRVSLVCGIPINPPTNHQFSGDMGLSKNMGKPPKSTLLIGFSLIFTIHFGVPLFLGKQRVSLGSTPWQWTISNRGWVDVSPIKHGVFPACHVGFPGCIPTFPIQNQWFM